MWYDLFSLFYDSALEQLYAPYRQMAADELRLARGDAALDVPCGTGQSLPCLVEAVGESGRVIGVDLSKGMLRKAKRRCQRAGWSQVSLLRESAQRLSGDHLDEALGAASVDGVLCALGLTAFPSWERTFQNLFSLVRPGGRFVILDVHSPARTLESRSVELVARADLSREAWRPLQAECSDFQKHQLPADRKKLGGDLFIASGTRSA